MTNPVNPLLAAGAITVGQPREVPFFTHPCLCVKNHVPKVNHTVRHHVIPLAWGGPDDESNLIDLCPTTHSEIHRMLDRFVRANKPVWQAGYSLYAYRLAKRAWEGKRQ